MILPVSEAMNWGVCMFEEPVKSGHWFSFGMKVAARTISCTAASAKNMVSN